MRVNSRVKDLAEAGLLVAIGFVLRILFPPIVMGMKPDFSLAMMFIILIVKRDLKLGFMVALATGIIAAMTTGFPGGQIANLVDKMVTYLAVSGLVYLIMDRVNNKVGVGIITALGTLFSGAIFLITASLLVGLPGSFTLLYVTVVVPTALINTITGIIIYLAYSYTLGVEQQEEVAI